MSDVRLENLTSLILTLLQALEHPSILWNSVGQGTKSGIFESFKKREFDFVFQMTLMYYYRTTFFFYDFWTSNKQNIFLFSQGIDDAIVIAPAKKRKTETNYQKSVICQKKLAAEALVAIPKQNSIENVLNLSRERYKYGNTAAAEFVQRTVNETASIICEKTCPITKVVIKGFQTDQN